MGECFIFLPPKLNLKSASKTITENMDIFQSAFQFELENIHDYNLLLAPLG